MSSMINLIISGQPQAKQRSRKGGAGNWYNPQEDGMNTVKRLIKDQLTEDFITIPKNIPVAVNVYWFIMPSKTMATKKFIDLIKNDDIPHLIKPDIDNLKKYILDCMSKIVFQDDCQVWTELNNKYWSNNPRTEIEIIW